MKTCPNCGTKIPETFSEEFSLMQTVTPKRKKQAKEKFVMPDWVPQPEWGDWLEMRQKMRKPATERAQKYALEDLDALRIKGENVREIVRTAIKKNWLAFYPSNGNGNGGYRAEAEPEPPSMVERERERERRFKERQKGMVAGV